MDLLAEYMRCVADNDHVVFEQTIDVLITLVSEEDRAIILRLHDEIIEAYEALIFLPKRTAPPP